MGTHKNQPSRQTHDLDAIFLSERALARRLGMSVKWLQALRMKGGGIPFLKLRPGGAVRYPLAAVEAYENSCLRTSTSDTGTESCSG